MMMMHGLSFRYAPFRGAPQQALRSSIRAMPRPRRESKRAFA